jgi:hypothetical protein
LTDVTADAVTGTATCTWNWRGEDCASTVPSLHTDVPSPLPQPKLKNGVPTAAGATVRDSAVTCAFPPVVQAVTVHPAVRPRSLLACADVTSMQSSAGGAWVAEAVVPVGVLVDVALLMVLVGAAVCAGLRVRVGADVAVEPPAAGLALTALVGVASVGVGVGDGLVVVLAVVSGSRRPDAVFPVALLVELVVTDAAPRGSHDVLAAVAAVPATAAPAAMTRVTPEAAVARAVPAVSVTVAGRACAKRMKTPTQAVRYCCGTTGQYGVWLHEARCVRSFAGRAVS